jgi:predicted membrane channel-forming protein YqfA (hemolysin III family)
MLASLIAAFVSGEAMDMVRRAKWTAIAYLLAAILCLCGLGFLIAAAYIVAAGRFGSVEAAIGFGIAFLVLAACVLAIRAIVASARRRRTRRTADLATIAGAAAVSALPLLLRSKAGIVGALVALAAYAIYRENRKDKSDEFDKLDK